MGIRVVDDYNSAPPGLYPKSIVVSTLGREIQFTAITQDRHEMWMAALNFLLQHQGPNMTSPGNFTVSSKNNTTLTGTTTTRNRRLSVIPDEHGKFRSPQAAIPRAMSVRSLETTPKAAYYRPGSSLSTTRKLSRTLTAESSGYAKRHAVPSPHFGGHRYKGTYHGAPFDRNRAEMEREYDLDGPIDDYDESFEGLDNVRGEYTSVLESKLLTTLACCDGKHLVGDGHHHHGSNKDKDSVPSTPIRAQTPSIRSRASSILSTVRRRD
jgi:hypothetical protein